MSQHVIELSSFIPLGTLMVRGDLVSKVTAGTGRYALLEKRVNLENTRSTDPLR